MWPSGRRQKTVNLPWRDPHRKFEPYRVRKLKSKGDVFG